MKLVELSGLRSTGLDTTPLPFFGVSSEIEDVEVKFCCLSMIK